MSRDVLLYGRRKAQLCVCILLANVVVGCGGSSTLPERSPDFANFNTAERTAVATDPLVVPDAVRLGILASNNVLTSGILSQQSANEATIARAAFYPELYSNLQPSLDADVLGVGSVGVRYTVYDFGQRTAELAAAEAAIERASYDQIVEVETTVIDVVTRYVDVAIETEKQAASQDYLAAIEDLEEAVRARVEIGVSSNVDLSAIQIGNLNASAELVNAEAEKRVASAAFSSLVQVDAKAVSGISTLSKVLSPGTGLLNLPQNLSEFPRVASLESEVEEARQRLAATKAGLLPQLGVKLGLGLEVGRSGIAETGLLAGPDISSAFSLGGGRAERVENAQLDVDIAQRALAEELRDVRLRFAQATTRLQASHSQIDKRKEVLSLARETRDIMLSEYNIGSRSLRDLINAEERIYDAVIALSEAHRTSLTARLELLAATNRLSENLYVSPR